VVASATEKHGCGELCPRKIGDLFYTSRLSTAERGREGKGSSQLQQEEQYIYISQSQASSGNIKLLCGESVVKKEENIGKNLLNANLFHDVRACSPLPLESFEGIT